MVQKNSVTLHKERIIVIAGPTGVGKSDYGVYLAKKYNGEVISADSVQFYEGFDIGSGKLTNEEMQGIPHHMLNIADPREHFTVIRFLELAKPIISDIIRRGKIPFVVGGTGFYINALLHGYNCGNTGPDLCLREKLDKLHQLKGRGYLYDYLKIIEPTTRIDPNDIVRIIRRLEMLLSPLFDKDNAPDYADIYDALLIILDADRGKLDEFAEKRIRGMIESGFEEEVRHMRKFYETRVFNSVGYREMKHYLCNQGDISMKETIVEMKKSYHALIKKQQTFFRWIKWENKVYSIDGDKNTANNAVKRFLEQK